MDNQRLESITELEREVLRLTYDGLGAKEIARELKIAERTVYQRCNRATAKLGVKTAEAARIIAAQEGRRPPAEIVHQIVHVAQPADSPHHWVLRFLIPEASGRKINDLAVWQRIVVILARAAFIILMIVAVAALLNEISRALLHPR